MADQGMKTEQATPRRLEKARQEGRFASSKEMVSAAQFLAVMALGAVFAEGFFGRVAGWFRHQLQGAFQAGSAPPEPLRFVNGAVMELGLPLAAAGGLLLAATAAVQLASTRFGLSLQRLRPELTRLNPLARLRELPKQNLPALVQAMVLLPLFAWAVYAVVDDNLPAFLSLPMASVRTGVGRLAGEIESLLWKAAGLFAVFGAIDFLRQKRRYARDLRMSRQEVREEQKEVEGDPHTRMRIRRMQRDLLRRRMMQEVPKATAVVVNPTHYAVAIRYEMQSMAAPKVVAKGKNFLAARIRMKAIENQVPIVENAPLAQALYKAVDVGQEIPPHLYRAVAEILAYIFRLARGRPGRNS